MNRGILKPELVELTSFIDDRGELVVGEWPNSLPFTVKRFFYVSNVSAGEARGIHAHKECQQFLVCVAGSLKASVDDGKTREEFALEAGGPGLYMPPLTWGQQYEYSSDAVLLVLASHEYDATDYVHEYKDLLKLVKEKDIKLT